MIDYKRQLKRKPI